MTVTYIAKNVEQTQTIAKNLSAKLQKGDLVVLSGDLGAGKTTFTKGIGEGMKVSGQISSPTFIVARVHPSLNSGPDLIHVDAYRINGIEDLETLDLDSTIHEAVTVIEWGEGKVENMAQSRLEIKISRKQDVNIKQDIVNGKKIVDLSNIEDSNRIIKITAYGVRWEKEELGNLL